MSMKPLLPHSCKTKKKINFCRIQNIFNNSTYRFKWLNMQISDALTINSWKCIYQFLLKPAEFKDKSRTFI